MGAITKILILAVLQGLTEFLPISSSGHLVLAKRLLALESPGATLEVALHGGTLLAVLVYYRKRIAAILAGLVLREPGQQRFALAIVLGAVPTVLAVVLFRSRLEALFDRPGLVGGMLLVSGGMLLSLLGLRHARRQLSPALGFVIGILQAVALVPGISRSGGTIVAARHLGLEPGKAAEFSLLLSVPCLIGACLLKGCEAGRTGLGAISLPALLLGVGVAAVVGYAAILVLVRTLKSGKFWLFGIYCCIVGILGLTCV